MKRKFWNWIRDESASGADAPRTLFLSGEISDETWFGDEVTPANFKDELDSGKGDISVVINSPGGDCFAAAQIFSMLKEYPGNVHVKIDSLAASAASVIAMAGDKVSINPVGMLMIHDPSMIAFGNRKDMEQAIAVLDEVKESIINAYSMKSGISRNKIGQLMSAETWMNAKKAKELGFVDEILYQDNAVPVTEDEPEEATPSEEEPVDKTVAAPSGVLFSRKALEDSFIAKVTDMRPKDMVAIENLDKRLSLLSH